MQQEPLSIFERVVPDGFGRVKGGRSPAKRTLDAVESVYTLAGLAHQVVSDIYVLKKITWQGKSR
jgi:hypothetical protein